MRIARRKSAWLTVAGACALAIAAIAGAARATPATGTVTPVIIGAGSMPTGMGLTARRVKRLAAGVVRRQPTGNLPATSVVTVAGPP